MLTFCCVCVAGCATDLMKALRPHKNIVQIYGVCLTTHQAIIVMEFLGKGSLVCGLISAVFMISEFHSVRYCVTECGIHRSRRCLTRRRRLMTGERLLWPGQLASMADLRNAQCFVVSTVALLLEWRICTPRAL